MAATNKTNKIVLNITSLKSIKAAKTTINGVKDHYTDTAGLLAAFSKEVEKSYMKPMIKKLQQQEPPKRKYPEDYPIVFKSEKQQRKVMSILHGKPYLRTHGLRQGWYYKIKKGTNKVTITVGNQKNYSKYVVGTFGLGESSRQHRRYVQVQQKFHKITGWKPAYVTIGDYLAQAKNAGTTFVQKWIDEGKLNAG